MAVLAMVVMVMVVLLVVALVLTESTLIVWTCVVLHCTPFPTHACLAVLAYNTTGFSCKFTVLFLHQQGILFLSCDFVSV